MFVCLFCDSNTLFSLDDQQFVCLCREREQHEGVEVEIPNWWVRMEMAGECLAMPMSPVEVRI